jgi:hypothetical protein
MSGSEICLWAWRRSIRHGPSGSDPLLLTKRNTFTSQKSFVSFPLIGLNVGQHRAKSLVRHDVALGHTPMLIEVPIRENPAIMAKLDVTIGIFVDPASLAAKLERLRAGLNQVHPTPIMEREFLRYLPIFLPGENKNEILIGTNGPMGIVIAEGGLAKSFVVVCHEFCRIGIGGLKCGDTT